jgi:hypothetical protein
MAIRLVQAKSQLGAGLKAAGFVRFLFRVGPNETDQVPEVGEQPKQVDGVDEHAPF